MRPPPVSPEHRRPHALLLSPEAFPARRRSHLGVRRTALLHGPAARPCILSPTAASTRPRSLAIYLAAVIRAVVALHHLIDNKLTNKEKESAADKEKEKEEKKEEKDKDEKPADEKPDDTKKGAK